MSDTPKIGPAAPTAGWYLDPLMLGLSAALLLSLSNIRQLSWPAGLAVLLLVLALAVLFGVRKWLADVQPVAEPGWLIRRARRKRSG